MMRMNQYVRVETLDEAYALLQKNRRNRIIGGMLWTRLQDTTVPVGIDLSARKLNDITETEDEVAIGAMVTLRELETNSVIASLYDGVIGTSVQDIVGVQFRNLATIGGSIYSRFGFSDILTALLALPVDVVLYHGGRMPLCAYVEKPYERDILTHIVIKKGEGRAVYLSERRSATDFPVLAEAVCLRENTLYFSIGARPGKAKLLTVSADMPDEEMIKQVGSFYEFGSNLRGSAEYREAAGKRAD